MRSQVFSEYAKIVLTIIVFGVMISFLTIYFPKYIQKYNCYLYLKTTMNPSELPKQCKFLYYSAKKYTIKTDNVKEAVEELVGLVSSCWIDSDRGTVTHDILCYLVKIDGNVTIKKEWILSNISSLTDVPVTHIDIKLSKLYKGNITLIIYNGTSNKIIIW